MAIIGILCRRLVFLLPIFIFVQLSCTHRNLPSRPAPPPIDFLELEAGLTVQVVIPITKSGSYVLPSIRQLKPNDFEVEAGDEFVGYEKALYKVVARQDGGVDVRFEKVTDWKNGKISSPDSPRLNLFEDSNTFRYFRLIFLTRESQADHNMAIVAANDRENLKRLSSAVTQSAECKMVEGGMCKWVPEGIAVMVDNHR